MVTETIFSKEKMALVNIIFTRKIWSNKWFMKMYRLKEIK